MAKKISELSTIVELSDSDLLPIVDVSANTTNKVTVADMKEDLVERLDELENGIYFKSGDSITFTDMVEAGFLTTGKTQVIFTITLPKSMANVSVSVEGFVAQVRNNNNYILGTGTAKASPSSVTISKVGDYYVRINITLASATSGATNNDACGINFDATINFN